MKTTHKILLFASLTLSACALRTEGAADGKTAGSGSGSDSGSGSGTACRSDKDCDAPPSACDIGACRGGACTYATSCGAGEACDARTALCESIPAAGHGTITCTDDGSVTHIAISAGVAERLIGQAAPGSDWTVDCDYGCSAPKAWIGDGVGYTLDASPLALHFALVLKEGNGTNHWFDVGQYVSSGTCSNGPDDTEFLHSTAAGDDPGVDGVIQCRLVALNGVEKLEVTLMPGSAGFMAGVVTEGTTPPSPEFVEVGADSLGWPSTQGRQAWVGDTASYRFYHDPGLNVFNYFVADDDDGGDSVPGGDYVDLSRWIITNPAPGSGSPYPAANCHVVGGGIRTD